MPLPDDVTLALEKPIGTDAESARRINEAAERLVGGDRVFRVDHFLGMAGVRRLMALRLAGGLIETFLTGGRVSGVEVVFHEEIGLEGRADFYEDTGAIADMIQSHLLQAMAVVMIPDRIGEDLPVQIEDILSRTALSAEPDAVVVGRYTAGTTDGERVSGYLDEPDTDPEGRVETYARLRLSVRADGWAGVPVTVETGKAIGAPRQEILVRRHADSAVGESRDELLRIGFENGSVRIDLQEAAVDAGTEWRTVELLDERTQPQLSAYGWVMRWLLEGSRAFSVSARAAEEAWRIVQPALDAIAAGQIPIRDYPAGTVEPLR